MLTPNISYLKKNILARILKFTIAEFQDLETEVIMELIEGEPACIKSEHRAWRDKSDIP